MKRTPFVLAAVLVTSLALPIAPVAAETIDLEPSSSSSFAWLDGHATDVAFDPIDRMWVWNDSYDPSFPHGQQTNVFSRGADGEWIHSFRFRLKRHDAFEVAFAGNGTVFSTDVSRCTLQITKLKANGAVKSSKKIKFKRSFCPSLAQPIDGGKLVLVGYGTTSVYKLPFSSRSKPIRTIRYEGNGITDELVGSDGTLYIARGDFTNQSVDVFPPTQRGDSPTSRTFAIHADYSPQNIVGMSFTREGDLALKMGPSVAVFSTTTEGDNQIPGTYYRFGAEPTLFGGDVEFDASGLMVVTEFLHELSVRVFFDSECRRIAQAVC